MSEQSARYPLAIRLLHWFMAVSILGLIATGWYMAELSDDASAPADLSTCPALNCSQQA